MPPKTFKRPTASQQVTKPKAEEVKDPSLNSEESNAILTQSS
jgi:hypothetical protein